MQTLDLAFLVDPLHTLKPYKDSSVAMMRTAAARGHRVWAFTRDALVWDQGHVQAQCSPITLLETDSPWYSAEPCSLRLLKDFDAVLMRQDPPFDFEYITATWLLGRAQAEGARIWNSPQAIRDHSEKIAITEFPQFTAPTRIARDAKTLHDFIDQQQDAILKPLDGMGGSQIFRVRADDPNRNVIVETLTALGTRTIMAQRYLPGISQGDKRVLVIGGQVIPYALARIPQKGETRGNLAAGGTGVAMPLTAQEKIIAETLAPILWQRGLLIVGLDVIDGHLTEINVTSPTCMVEIKAQTGFDVPGKVIDCLEAIAHEPLANR